MKQTPKELLQEADRCVKCGLCLAVCPTYQVLANEADSPRGRISLLQGLWTGALEVDEPLEGHLHGCLQCLRCQAACPSGVNYQRLIEAGLETLPKHHGWHLWLLTHAPAWPWLVRFFAFWQRSLLFKTGLGLLPGAWRSLLLRFPEYSPLPDTDRAATAETALFLGCISRLVDSPAHLAFVRLCNALGLGLVIPDGQGCCGALHAHAGRPDQAKAFASQNAAAFAQASQIISLATACGAHLQRLEGARVLDAALWLNRQPWPQSVELQPFAQRVAVHSPCSQRPVELKAVLDLLKRVPGLEVIELGAGFGCCGGAGMALVEQVELGYQLVSPLIAHIRDTGVSLVLTSSSGCALQLKRALAEAGLAVEVLHPLELLARQLG